MSLLKRPATPSGAACVPVRGPRTSATGQGRTSRSTRQVRQRLSLLRIRFFHRVRDADCPPPLAESRITPSGFGPIASTGFPRALEAPTEQALTPNRFAQVTCPHTSRTAPSRRLEHLHDLSLCGGLPPLGSWSWHAPRLPGGSPRTTSFAASAALSEGGREAAAACLREKNAWAWPAADLIFGLSCSVFDRQ